MNLNELFGVSPAKARGLLERMRRLGVDPRLIEESFIKGGGNGGQKINKTANCVVLRYSPRRLVVRAQRDRKRTVNRFLALRELVDRVEIIVSPQTSGRLLEIERLRRRKARRRRRSAMRRSARPAEKPPISDDPAA